MDFVIIVIVMLVLYVVPELLRKRRPQKYEYPDIPQPVQVKMPSEMSLQNKTEVKHHEGVKPTFVMPPEVSIPSVQEKSPWQGKFNNTVLYNGIIFAEILQPPRARRPMLRHNK